MKKTYSLTKEVQIFPVENPWVFVSVPKKSIAENSVRELQYHAEVFQLLGVDTSAKIQIHVGGVYGDKEAAIDRFCTVYSNLPKHIKQHLVIENDDVSFSVQDCLKIHRRVGIPILFDNFHHECLHNGESLAEVLPNIYSTWKKTDGRILMDYSSQQAGVKKGKHADHVDQKHFSEYYKHIQDQEIDIIFEIKDKEKSCLAVQNIL